MKKEPVFMAILYLFFVFSGSLYGIGEKTIALGGAAAWGWAEFRTGITEVISVRPHPVLVLSSAANPPAASGALSSGAVSINPVSISSSSPALDLSLSFDERNPSLFRDAAGHYRIIVSPALESVDRRFSRAGFGAALFPGVSGIGVSNNGAANGTASGAAANGTAAGAAAGPLIIEPQSRNALFAPNSRIRDFSLEFWLYPLNMENGEQILTWISSRPVQLGQSRSGYVFQRIQCVAAKNRLQWSFADFFASPDGNSSLSVIITGASPVVPKNWSHHLIRFDSGTGLLEYLVNGKTEAIEYVNSTGHEGGEVYTPIAGEGGSFALGGQFMGILDEFKIHGAWIDNPSVQKYPLRGGRMETGVIDLGEGNSGVIRVDAAGGRTAIRGTKISSEFRENGRFRFADDSELQFFIRAADNRYRWNESDWRNFTPGEALSANVRGRYVQIAVDFYPSSDGETSPYLENLRITYIPDEPPLPPASLTAVALDGGVRLRWKNSPDTETAGYLVYYGTARDDYFSEDAAQGVSPIDAGKQNAITIDGLKNGTLYYFRVAAYDRRPAAGDTFHAGEFSREVSARPLRGLITGTAR
jgi:hypothetical protein